MMIYQCVLQKGKGDYRNLQPVVCEITFSLFESDFMLAQNNFSGSVALNYETYTRNWTVNFIREKSFFTTTSLQAVKIHHCEEEGSYCFFLPDYAVNVDTLVEMLNSEIAPINALN